MSDPYVGEIRMFGGNFAPQGWSFCNGSLIAISQNDTLFNLIGTTYGGDGQNTFALPDLQGRVPVHVGQGQGLSSYVLGQKAGFETITLITAQLPAHSHVAAGSSTGNPASNPSNAVWGNNAITNKSFGAGTSVDGNLNTSSLQMTGGSQPHDNMLPFLAISFIISLFGIYPTQS
jgi:microcystin-dependent protein